MRETCDSSSRTNRCTVSVHLNDCQVIEDHIAADGIVAGCCRVVVNQTTGHPEALCTTVVVNATAIYVSMVAGDLACVEGEDTVVEDTTTVAGCVTTDDLTVSGLIHDSEHTVVNDDTTISDSACERTVNDMSVQIQHHRCVCRYF